MSDPPMHSLDEKRLALLLRESGLADQEALGLLDDAGTTRRALVVLATKVDPEPPGFGFDVRAWPVMEANRADLEPPSCQHYGAPVLQRLQLIADERAIELAPETTPALFDHTREVIVEILVNALKHRDPEANAPIRIDAFTDSLAVWSPGEPEFAEIARGSFRGTGSRDPLLDRLLRILGYGRSKGVGWERARLLAQECGLRLTASTERGGVRVHVAVNASRQAEIEVRDAIGAEIRARNPEATWEDRLLAHLDDGEWWKPKDIGQAIGIPRSSLSRILKKLESAGRVERSNASKNAPTQNWRLIRR